MATAAGVMFLRNNYDTLMGFTPKHSHYSGFGGMREPEESILMTALREAVEELYGIRPDVELLDELVDRFSENPRYERDGYLFILIWFDEYPEFADIVRFHARRSPYYERFPKSIKSLVRKRRTVADMEITHLIVGTPMGNYDYPVDPDFIADWDLACRDVLDDMTGYSSEDSE